MVTIGRDRCHHSSSDVVIITTTIITIVIVVAAIGVRSLPRGCCRRRPLRRLVVVAVVAYSFGGRPNESLHADTPSHMYAYFATTFPRTFPARFRHMDIYIYAKKKEQNNNKRKPSKNALAPCFFFSGKGAGRGGGRDGFAGNLLSCGAIRIRIRISIRISISRDNDVLRSRASNQEQQPQEYKHGAPFTDKTKTKKKHLLPTRRLEPQLCN